MARAVHVREELDGEIAAGVRFWGSEEEGELSGVMGVQAVRDVHLIRHAYVRPGQTRAAASAPSYCGHLLDRVEGTVLVGTWATATWAIAFYERNGFGLTSPEEKDRLLREYWSIPERQVATSVVLRGTSTLE